MTLPIPLTVRLVTDRADRHIKADLHDLSFRSVVPGGFASMRMTISRSLATQPDEIAYYGRAIVYDERNGNTVWEGRLEDPGRAAGDSGELWELAAVGPSAHAQDRTVPLILLDRRLSAWKKANNASGERPSASVSASDDQGGTSAVALVLSFPAGLTIPTNSACTAVYYAFDDTFQNMAFLDYRWDAGITNASWRVHGLSSPIHLVRDQAASTAGSSFSMAVVGFGAFALGDNIPFIRLTWNSAPSSTGGSDDVWASIMDLVVGSTTFSKAGVEKTSGYTGADRELRAHTIVEDLLGRLLIRYDGANATVDATSTFPITQWAYPAGATPAEMLDDLMALEPSYYWAAWEQNPITGKHRFEWRKWPTTVRYEADVTDGYSAPGSAEGLYDRATVRWTDALDRTRTVEMTQTVPQLTAAGFSRQTFIDLGENFGGLTEAQQTGGQFLAEHAVPLNAGRLTVSRPIYDHDRGSSIMPWEIRPGHLIRVRGILPSTDALNATARDGVTVFKVMAVDYDTSSASATLELDSNPLTLAHLMSRNAKPKAALRRRRW